MDLRNIIRRTQQNYRDQQMAQITPQNFQAMLAKMRSQYRPPAFGQTTTGNATLQPPMPGIRVPGAFSFGGKMQPHGAAPAQAPTSRNHMLANALLGK